MINVMKEVNKIVEDSKKRWKEISELSDRLKSSLNNDNVSMTQHEMDSINLLLLLTEHLKPASDTINQAEKMQKEISSMLSELENKFKK